LGYSSSDVVDAFSEVGVDAVCKWWLWLSFNF
jgi:hypothetical protein